MIKTLKGSILLGIQKRISSLCYSDSYEDRLFIYGPVAFAIDSSVIRAFGDNGKNLYVPREYKGNIVFLRYLIREYRLVRYVALVLARVAMPLYQTIALGFYLWNISSRVKNFLREDGTLEIRFFLSDEEYLKIVQSELKSRGTEEIPVKLDLSSYIRAIIEGFHLVLKTIPYWLLLDAHPLYSLLDYRVIASYVISRRICTYSDEIVAYTTDHYGPECYGVDGALQYSSRHSLWIIQHGEEFPADSPYALSLLPLKSLKGVFAYTDDFRDALCGVFSINKSNIESKHYEAIKSSLIHIDPRKSCSILIYGIDKKLPDFLRLGEYLISKGYKVIYKPHPYDRLYKGLVNSESLLVSSNVLSATFAQVFLYSYSLALLQHNHVSCSSSIYEYSLRRFNSGETLSKNELKYCCSIGTVLAMQGIDAFAY